MGLLLGRAENGLNSLSNAVVVGEFGFQLLATSAVSL
jgi:hypothetical protein